MLRDTVSEVSMEGKACPLNLSGTKEIIVGRLQYISHYTLSVKIYFGMSNFYKWAVTYSLLVGTHVYGLDTERA